MIIQKKQKKRSKKLFLQLITLLLCCIISFFLGILLLKNGTLRKWYDDLETIIYCKDDFQIENFKHNIKIDTIKIKLSKKSFNEISVLRSNTINKPKNFLNYEFQWDVERPWIKTKIVYNHGENIKGRIKLIGLNADHFRDGINWSTRIKLKEGRFIYGFSKFNLLNPYSRGYFIDLYYNEINRLNGGLYIPTKPIITQLGNEKIFQLFEPFFSKELIEYNHHKDYLILNADSTDRKNKKHLRIIHPNSGKITESQKRVYKYYESQFQLNKLDQFTNKKDLIMVNAIGINAGNHFHHMGFNAYYYADPMLGELRLFIREVSPSNNTKIDLSKSLKLIKLERTDSLELKEKIYSKLNELNSTIFKKILTKSKNFKNLYFQSLKLEPRSKIYTKRINSLVYNSPKTFKKYLKKSKLITLKSMVINNKTLIFNSEDSILFTKNCTVRLINSHVIFKGSIRNLGDLKFNLDNKSTLVFERCKIYFKNVTFSGGGIESGPKLKNRQFSSPFNFAECEIIHLTKCSFLSNYEGDDLANFYRSTIFINNLKIKNAKFDGLDFDWCRGEINNCQIYNCGNDGLDFAGSQFSISNSMISACQDKGVSIGEKSNITFNNVSFNVNEIGVALKDESNLIINKLKPFNNKIDLVAYSKKGEYGASSLIDKSFNLEKLNYLIEHEVKVESPFKMVIRVREINKLMYGNKYGKASVR